VFALYSQDNGLSDNSEDDGEPSSNHVDHAKLMLSLLKRCHSAAVIFFCSSG